MTKLSKGTLARKFLNVAGVSTLALASAASMAQSHEERPLTFSPVPADKQINFPTMQQQQTQPTEVIVVPAQQQQTTTYRQVQQAIPALPWANDPNYIIERQNLELRALPDLQQAKINHQQANAACTERWFGKRDNLRGMDDNKVSKMSKLSKHNSNNASFNSCVATADTRYNRTVNNWKVRFNNLEMKYSERYQAFQRQCAQRPNLPQCR